MALDLNNVDITKEIDWVELEENWSYYYDHKYDFSKMRTILEKINIITGFGRGFWAGIDHYFYVVYHEVTDGFYWFLKDIESDDRVCFYKIEQDDPFLELLRNKPINIDFDDYDEVIDYGTLYSLSIGKKVDERLTSLETLFGEDTKKLRLALMYFSPASNYGDRPHKVFDEEYANVSFERSLDEKVKLMNESKERFYRDGKDIYVLVNGEKYKLEKIKKT